MLAFRGGKDPEHLPGFVFSGEFFVFYHTKPPLFTTFWKNIRMELFPFASDFRDSKFIMFRKRMVTKSAKHECISMPPLKKQ